MHILGRPVIWAYLANGSYFVAVQSPKDLECRVDIPLRVKTQYLRDVEAHTARGQQNRD